MTLLFLKYLHLHIYCSHKNSLINSFFVYCHISGKEHIGHFWQIFSRIRIQKCSFLLVEKTSNAFIDFGKDLQISLSTKNQDWTQTYSHQLKKCCNRKKLRFCDHCSTSIGVVIIACYFFVQKL